MPNNGICAGACAWCNKEAYCRRDEMEWVERLATEYDEIRAALDWAIEQGDCDAALQLVGSLWWFWMLRGWVPPAALERATLEGRLMRPDDVVAYALAGD